MGDGGGGEAARQRWVALFVLVASTGKFTLPDALSVKDLGLTGTVSAHLVAIVLVDRPGELLEHVGTDMYLLGLFTSDLFCALVA